MSEWFLVMIVVIIMGKVVKTLLCGVVYVIPFTVSSHEHAYMNSSYSALLSVNLGFGFYVFFV